jgi:peptide chain release factor 1
MISKSDLTIRYTRGRGPGGQNKNKVHSCVVIVHTPTGITVRIDGRDRVHNEREALREIESRVEQRKLDVRAGAKKANRDRKIADGGTPIIRTYDYKAGQVRDHRTKKTAPIKEVLEKGRIDLLGKPIIVSDA